MGWTLHGEIPNRSKVVFAAVPHSSNWDLIIALATMMALGLRFSWMMKKEAFVWPFSMFWKKMGGIPIDRIAKMDVTTQTVAWFDANEKGFLGITPEGTRGDVDQYKRGYLRIAYAAKVPVAFIALNAPKKEIWFDKEWPLTGDIHADNAAIKAYVEKTWVGINQK